MELSEENLTALVYSVGVLRGESREKRPMEQALASLERFREVRSAYLTGFQRPSGYIKTLSGAVPYSASAESALARRPKHLGGLHPGISGAQRLSSDSHVSDTANRNASLAWLLVSKEKVVRFLQAMPTLYCCYI